MQDEISGIYGERIAKIIFNEPADQLRIIRTVSEFTVEIPITIRFRTMPDELEHLYPTLNYLWGEVFTANRPNDNYAVGKISQLDFKEDFSPNWDSVSKIKWSGNLSSLALFEKIRDGGTPKIQLSMHGEYYYSVDVKSPKTPRIRTESKTFWLNYNIEISKDLWIDRLRKIDFLENVLIEIPLPTSPASPWDEVWKALVDARIAFEKGGATAWKDSVVSCRLALEKWQGIEKEDMGPGWKSPPPADRRLRTKEQRLDNIRWHLLQLAHDSAHSHADKWSREDALLMLSTLSALLAKRNP